MSCRWRRMQRTPHSRPSWSHSRRTRSGACLGVLPEGFHFLERRLGRLPALGRELLLDIAEALLELVVGRAQGGFRVDLAMAREVRHGEQYVAQLVGDARGVERAGLDLAAQLAELFLGF